MVENSFNKKIKSIRSDGGGEYVKRDFQNFCESEGIRMENSVPYTPHQNDVAERKNRSLKQMETCLLHGKNLPPSLWACYHLSCTYWFFIKWETSGLCPNSASKGVAPITDLWGTLFWMYEAQFTASAQREGGRCLAWRRHVSISFSDFFFLSTTPFCCGVYGTECFIWITPQAHTC